MSAPISVIIPTRNAADQIGPTLAALVEGVGEGLIAEVILSDGGSGDDIAQIAEEVGAQFLTGEPGRGGQLARGAAAARAPWLLFLHADSVPGPGWTTPVSAHLGHPKHAGYFDLRFDSAAWQARALARWANLRSRLARLPYGDQGLLIARTLYDAAGGFADIPLMEDVALARALRTSLRPLDHPILTSPRRYEQEGWAARAVGNGWLLAQYLAGRDPSALARKYRS